MNVYVGITDWDWYDFLRTRHLAEVNFWKPSGKPFKAISEGDMFLFKLKASRGGRIAGGGFLVGAPTTSIDWAWRAFGDENGVSSLLELNDKIWHYRKVDGRYDPNASVTSIILTDVFYLDQADWFSIADHWSPSIMTGKTFKGAEATRLVREVEMRLRAGYTLSPNEDDSVPSAPAGTILMPSRHRIGQGAFRTLVAGAYERRCAITGERTVPVLQAAHIKSFASQGPNSVNNGILLRSDMHALFDTGYITIEYDSSHSARTVVSGRLHEDFGNGKDYYPYHGRKLAVLPREAKMRPSQEYLDWHHEHVYLG